MENIDFEKVKRSIGLFKSSLSIKLKQRLKEKNNRAFAKKIENMFLSSNVIIVSLLMLASYTYILGPGVNPSKFTVGLFLVFSVFSLFLMEAINKRTSDPNEYNINLIRITLISVPIALLVMNTIGLASVFEFTIITFMVMSPLVFFIRSKWKISGHMCTFTAMATIMSMMNGWFAAFYIVLPVISWSRLKLNAHTRTQVIAGVLLGFLTPLTFSILIPLI
jgi:membrane-associated phospholipid phosphatase